MNAYSPSREEAHSHFTQAIYTGDLTELERWLPHVDPAADDSRALRIAADQGHLAVVERLLPFSDPKAHSSKAFYCACRNGHLAIAQRLAPLSDVGDRNHRAFWSAVSEGHESIVAFLLDLGYYDFQAEPSKLLSLAAFFGHVGVARLLLPHSDPKHGARPPLLEAAYHGHLAMVEFLLPVSNDPALYAQALVEAVLGKQRSLVELLLTVADPRLDSSRALKTAAETQQADLISLLLPRSDAKAVWAEWLMEFSCVGKSFDFSAMDTLGIALPPEQQAEWLADLPEGYLPLMESAQRSRQRLQQMRQMSAPHDGSGRRPRSRS